MPKGIQLAVTTPGQHQRHYLVGALLHCLGARKTNALFRELLGILCQVPPVHAQPTKLSTMVPPLAAPLLNRLFPSDDFLCVPPLPHLLVLFS
jgi:hypothetical protein